MILSDLSAIQNELARIKTIKTLPSVSTDPPSVVYLSQPDFRLQTSLVRCAGRSSPWFHRGDRCLQLLFGFVRCPKKTHKCSATDTLRTQPEPHYFQWKPAIVDSDRAYVIFKIYYLSCRKESRPTAYLLYLLYSKGLIYFT